jgi:hypothetical protein
MFNAIKLGCTYLIYMIHMSHSWWYEVKDMIDKLWVTHDDMRLKTWLINYESHRDMIIKLCYLPNWIYFDLLSHSRLNKLNKILAH